MLTVNPFGDFNQNSFRTPLPADNTVSIPLLTSLIPDGVKPGTLFVVEFDPESQWLAVAATITAGYLQAGGRVAYVAELRSPETVRENLFALGVDIPSAIRERRFRMDDWYSATLSGGRLEGGGVSLFDPIEGGVRTRSLKVADLSVQWLKDMRGDSKAWDVEATWPPGALVVIESISQELRFNEEKPYLEWAISRVNPHERKTKRIKLLGVVRDLHSESFYKQLETAYDGVIDLRLMEQDEEVKNLLRIRSLKGQPHNTRWHEIQIQLNSQAVLLPYLAKSQ